MGQASNMDQVVEQERKKFAESRQVGLAPHHTRGGGNTLW
jgi:hypothetical protein